MSEQRRGVTVPFGQNVDLAAAVSSVQDALLHGGVVLLPTETFYGLACDPRSEKGVHRVLRLKGRPRNMALPVLAADWDQVDRLTQVTEVWRCRLQSLWPGPITAVLPLQEDLAASPAATVAVRIPGHRLLRRMLCETGPLTGTSANRHGDPPATTVAEAMASLLGEPDLILDGGPTPGGQPSTLVDLTGERPRILRQGPEVWDENTEIGKCCSADQTTGFR